MSAAFLSKALLHASELYEMAAKDFAGFGIDATVKLNLPNMLSQKDASVTALTKGVEFLFKKNKVDWIKGAGSVAGAGKVIVKAEDGAEVPPWRPRRSLSPRDRSRRPCRASRSTRCGSSNSTGALALSEVLEEPGHYRRRHHPGWSWDRSGGAGWGPR